MFGLIHVKIRTSLSRNLKVIFIIFTMYYFEHFVEDQLLRIEHIQTYYGFDCTEVILYCFLFTI